MVLRVKLVGGGKVGDPFRVNLPTYDVILANYSKGYALVQIPDDVHGLSSDDLSNEEAEATNFGDHFQSLAPAVLNKLHDNLDKRYQEHRGEFRIELA